MGVTFEAKQRARWPQWQGSVIVIPAVMMMLHISSTARGERMVRRSGFTNRIGALLVE